MAVQFVCDSCEETVDNSEVIELTIANSKTNETTLTHACAECFDEVVSGNKATAANLLLG